MARQTQISKLIAELQDVQNKWGDTCVHIRAGGLTWGATALHANDDDRKGILAALRNLANAADSVGVKFFDTDTMEPEVEAMQQATKAARAALEL